MEFIHGMTLERLWDPLQPADKLDISRQIVTAVDELRRLPPPPYIGAVGRQSLPDGAFWVPENSGPFQNEEEMNEGMRKNIMINRTGTKEDGNGIFEIKLIDWEISGWYPEYWEFGNAAVPGRFRPEWLEVVQRILQIYPTEYLMMLAIRNILFY
ncbi:MAG: hypothetical protein M1818_005209 [Claussenomyces sp. TS43310]|nr:MAG: hypothetical protein M1818_005209 [Claussenomyces sp. TS43310]